MKVLIHVVCRAVTVATILCILAAAVFVVPKTVGIVPYIVRSGSMEPEIKTGAIAFINVRYQDVEKGDIVTYRMGGQAGKEMFVTHRVIGLEDGGYVTKGDANDVRDPYLVREEQIVGTYLCQIPKAGYLMAKMNRKVLTVAVVWIFLLNGAALVLGSAIGEGSRP